jgi:hypothetical protein
MELVRVSSNISANIRKAISNNRNKGTHNIGMFVSSTFVNNH